MHKHAIFVSFSFYYLRIYSAFFYSFICLIHFHMHIYIYTLVWYMFRLFYNVKIPHMYWFHFNSTLLSLLCSSSLIFHPIRRIYFKNTDIHSQPHQWVFFFFFHFVFSLFILIKTTTSMLLIYFKQ